MEDPDGRANFNAMNLENANGFYWGVMGLTLNQNGYAWEFKSALEAPLAGAPSSSSPTFKDSGVGTCHGSPTGGDQIVFAVRLTFPTERVPPLARNREGGSPFAVHSVPARSFSSFPTCARDGRFS